MILNFLDQLHLELLFASPLTSEEKARHRSARGRLRRLQERYGVLLAAPAGGEDDAPWQEWTPDESAFLEELIYLVVKVIGLPARGEHYEARGREGPE
jgi:hypothetical protein